MAGVVSAVEAIAIPMTSLRILKFPFCIRLEALAVSIFSLCPKQVINAIGVLQECRYGVFAAKIATNAQNLAVASANGSGAGRRQDADIVQNADQLFDCRARLGIDVCAICRGGGAHRSKPVSFEEQAGIGFDIKHLHPFARRNKMPVTTDPEREMAFAPFPRPCRWRRHAEAIAIG